MGGCQRSGHFDFCGCGLGDLEQPKKCEGTLPFKTSGRGSPVKSFNVGQIFEHQKSQQDNNNDIKSRWCDYSFRVRGPCDLEPDVRTFLSSHHHQEQSKVMHT